MRRTTIFMACAALLGLVSVSQAGLFNWRLGWRPLARPVISQPQTNPLQAREAAPAPEKPAEPSPTSPSLVRTSRAARPSGHRYRTLDERRVAELGPNRARMVYPSYDDVDPYPTCRAWTWDDEDGWHWEWSEANCPWRQLHDRIEFDSD